MAAICPFPCFFLLAVALLSSGLSASEFFGPYHKVFGENREQKISWYFVKADDTKSGDDVVYITLSLAPGLRWMTFGFREPSAGVPDDDDDPIPMDLIFVYLDHNGHAKIKDGVSTSFKIKFDKQQDFTLESSRSSKKSGINVTVYRKFDTGDVSDVVLRGGMIALVHCYGEERTMKTIQTKFVTCRDMDDVEFVPASFFGGEAISNVERTVTQPPRTAAVVTRKEASTPRKFTPDASKIINDGGAAIFRGVGPKPGTVAPRPATDAPVQTRIVIVKVPVNCTAGPNAKSWYEVLKVRENSIYYAIIGTSALLTGILVLLIACCCGRATPALPRNSAKSKVAFYKVDDYDDEHVEFLKENS